MADQDDARRPPLRTRLRAAAIDVRALLMVGTAMLVMVLVYLLVRTSWGRDDVGLVDSFIAVSLLGAVAPSWAVRRIAEAARDGATRGQRRAGLRVVGTPRRRAARFLAHPLSFPLWAWLTLTLLFGGVPWLPLAPLAIAVMVLLAGLVSLAMLLIDANARPVHDRVAGTRLAVAGDAAA